MPVPPAVYDLAPGTAILRFVGYDRQVIHFRVKKTTPIMRAMKLFSERVGESLPNLRFYFQRRQIRSNDTHRTLGMNMDDYITVKRIRRNADNNNGRISIKAVCKVTNRQIHFHINPILSLKRMMTSYCEHSGGRVGVHQLSFIFHGKVIRDDHTPWALKMKQDDIIVVEYKTEE